MDDAARELVAEIHATAPRGVFALTGGGGPALAALLGVPGASRTVLEAVVPYHPNSLAEYVGGPPAQACSPEVAVALADRAFARARRLTPADPVFGIGLTAALATDRVRRGEDRFFLAAASPTGRDLYTLTFEKGGRDRAGQDAVVLAAVVNATARLCGVRGRLPLADGDEPAHTGTLPDDGPLAAFLRGELPAVCQEPDGRFRRGGPPPAALLPGSFNPLHVGHRQMAEVAARRLGVPVAFELTVQNADKPGLSADEVRRRLPQFLGRGPVWLTRSGTYPAKAELFPGAAFVLGADTAARVVQPRFYGDDPAAMAAALGRLREAGCRFLVAGRADAGGRFVGLGHLDVPDEYRDLFAGLTEADFRIDISSTQLRSPAPA